MFKQDSNPTDIGGSVSAVAVGITIPRWFHPAAVGITGVADVCFVLVTWPGVRIIGTDSVKAVAIRWSDTSATAQSTDILPVFVARTAVTVTGTISRIMNEWCFY